MVGLGETSSEIISVMQDLKAHGCRILTIGQYLQPSPEQVSVKQFITPEMFDFYRDEAQRIGFDAVYSGPFVRSSYRADEFFNQ
jgi:lipoic acid synthetase